MPIGFVSGGWVIPRALDTEIVAYSGTITIELVEPDCESKQIEMYRGDDHVQGFIVKSNGVPIDMSGAALTFSVKKKQTDSTYLFQRKSALAGGGSDEIELEDPVNGKFFVIIIPENTEGLDGNTKYYYDVEMVLSNSITTIVKDRIYIKFDIT